MEWVGGLFVFGQAIIFAPSIWRLYKDKSVQGVSIPTIAFYAFVSAWYLPLYWHWKMYATFWGLVFVFLAELIWVIYALRLKFQKVEVKN